MKFHKIHYNCKICGRAGTANADTDCPPGQIDILAKCLCCNVCGDARESVWKAEKRIFEACHYLINIQTVKNRQRVTERAREVLGFSLRKWAEAQCAMRRMPLVWDSSFIEQLMRTPEKAGDCLKFYRQNLTPIQP